MRLAGLYAITPDAGDSRALVERVRIAMQAGAPCGWAALQYRSPGNGGPGKNHRFIGLQFLPDDINCIIKIYIKVL